MQINRSSNRKKYIIIGIIAGLILISGTTYAIVSMNQSEPKSTKPTKEETKAGNSAKLETLNENTESGENNSTTGSSKNKDESTDTSESATINITAKNQNGSLFQIRAMIDVIETGGTCTLTLSKGNSVVTRQVQTQALAQATTCQGFDIPVSELSAGTWDTKISYEHTGVTAEVTDTIEVK